MNIMDSAIKKALKSQCSYKVSVIGFSGKGEFLGICYNIPRFKTEGGSIHAEIVLINKYGSLLKTIVLCRVGRGGNLLPIHPCKNCQKILNKLGIKVKTIGREK